MEGGTKIPPVIGIAAIAGAAFLFYRSRKTAAAAAPSGLTALNRAIDNIVGGFSGAVSDVVKVPVQVVGQVAGTASAVAGAGLDTAKYLGVTALRAPAVVVKTAPAAAASAVGAVGGLFGGSSQSFTSALLASVKK